MSLYHIAVGVHLLAAIVWLGGTFFLALVGGPVLRKIESAGMRARLFDQIGIRFRAVGWVSIVVLIVTGFIVLDMRGVMHTSILGSSAFWRSRFGVALAWKLIAVAVMIVSSAVHDFWLGKASAVAQPGSPRALRLRRMSVILARGAAFVGVFIVFAAVRLAR